MTKLQISKEQNNKNVDSTWLFGIHTRIHKYIYIYIYLIGQENLYITKTLNKY
jgi:hypothetical protein